MARKEKNIHYIYKTTCNVTGRWYVGMHSTSNDNDGYMGSGTVLRRSIRKYGKENHTKEILEYLPNRVELAKREREIVNKELICDGLCMNLTIGGEAGGFIDDAHQIKCSKAGKEAFNLKMKTDISFNTKMKAILMSNTRKAHEDGNCKYDNFKGKTHSDESKQLISENKKGTGTEETNSQFGTCWITKDGINKKIKKEDLETYQLDGWLKGRKIK